MFCQCDHNIVNLNQLNILNVIYGLDVKKITAID